MPQTYQSASGLHLPDQQTADHAAGDLPKPKLGPSYGAWSREHLGGLQLPGGALLQFDLSRLGLSDFRAMRDHYQINISLSILTFMMHGLDWRIECDDQNIADALEEDLRGDTWTRLIRALSQSYWAGYSPIVQEYENDVNTMRVRVNKFKDLVPEESRVNWKEVDGYAPEGHPKPQLKEFDGIKHEGSSFPVPVEHSLWYPLLMENGNFYGRKLLRPAFPPWFFSQLIHLFANRYFERFGEPLPVGRAPFDDDVVDESGNTISGRAAMENILSAIKNRAVAVLPSDRTPTMGQGGASEYEYQIEYLESQMRGADFERYLTRLDEEMSLGIFTPVLLIRTADVGSYNLGELHLQMWNRLINALTGDMAEYINRFVINRLVQLNWPGTKAVARWIPRKLGKDRQTTLQAIIQTMISSDRASVDVDELGAALGLTVHEIDQLAKEQPSKLDDPSSSVEGKKAGKEDATDPNKQDEDPGGGVIPQGQSGKEDPDPGGGTI